MDQKTRDRLIAAGFRIGDAEDFLGFNEEETCRLIAAAPELLDACVKMLAALETATPKRAQTFAVYDAMDALRAAIAKATGA